MTTFAAIDFETANYRPNSACALGVVVVAASDAEACARIVLTALEQGWRPFGG